MRCSKNGLAAVALAAAVCGLPGTATAQLFIANPDFKPGPIDGSDPLVGLPLPGATAQEYSAHLLWNLRAGLNVSALQCQFSPYLRVVDNYNGILAHHGKELMAAYTTVNGYFKRKYGPRDGQKRFDDYSTMTYNGFSTLQAQHGFCHISSDIAKEALARPKGQMHLTAQGRLRELRNSLVAAYDKYSLTYNPQLIRLPVLPPLEADCYDRKNRLKKKCMGGRSS